MRAATPSRTQSRLNWKRSSLVFGSSGSMPASISRAMCGYRPEDSNQLRKRSCSAWTSSGVMLASTRSCSAWKRTSWASRITAPMTKVATVMKMPMTTR